MPRKNGSRLRRTVVATIIVQLESEQAATKAEQEQEGEDEVMDEEEGREERGRKDLVASRLRSCPARS